MEKKEHVVASRGNVFEDIGLSHPARVMARAQVMKRIAEIVAERGLTQKEAAAVMDVSQSKVSCLRHGKLSMFSMDHLFEMLNALDSDVEIVIRTKSPRARKAKTTVSIS